jgi:predicted patatin/cPLA2 family phospholipase
MKLLSLVLTLAATAATAVAAATCNVLALSGGGAFGAVEMGVLDSLTATGAAPSQYDVITGISAGGLNTGFLAYYDDVREALPLIHSIYANITTADVYTPAYLSIFSKWAIYDNTPLKETLRGVLAGRTEPAAGPLAMIGATNLNESVLDVFVFNDKSLDEKLDVLIATSSIPLAFPPHTINGTLYVDGGVISSELIKQVVGFYPCDSYNITFLSAYRKAAANPPVNGFFSYTSNVFHTLYKAFDSQFSQESACPRPYGTIQACYPTAPELDAYSMLDFDHGAELYALAKGGHHCDRVPLC